MGSLSPLQMRAFVYGKSPPIIHHPSRSHDLNCTNLHAPTFGAIWLWLHPGYQVTDKADPLALAALHRISEELVALAYLCNRHFPPLTARIREFALRSQEHSMRDRFPESPLARHVAYNYGSRSV